MACGSRRWQVVAGGGRRWRVVVDGGRRWQAVADRGSLADVCIVVWLWGRLYVGLLGAIHAFTYLHKGMLGDYFFKSLYPAFHPNCFHG